MLSGRLVCFTSTYVSLQCIAFQILRFGAFDTEAMLRTLVAVGTLVSLHSSGSQCIYTHAVIISGRHAVELVQYSMPCGVQSIAFCQGTLSCNSVRPILVET